MSALNDKVTRWRKDTTYTFEYFSTKDRELRSEQRVIKGRRDAKYIRQKLAKTMPAGTYIVSVRVDSYRARLYAMGEEQFYANARVIAEKKDEERKEENK